MRNCHDIQCRGPCVIYNEDNGIIKAFGNNRGTTLLNLSKLSILKLILVGTPEQNLEKPGGPKSPPSTTREDSLQSPEEESTEKPENHVESKPTWKDHVPERQSSPGSSGWIKQQQQQQRKKPKLMRRGFQARGQQPGRKERRLVMLRSRISFWWGEKNATAPKKPAAEKPAEKKPTTEEKPEA
ncbi:hypothetical protein mRhiFer1_008400 [Rhinolophus ferrumequinum]|uniref:Uncharacterized protein n=1 Tax=Rhinolophus ferrumequinum TaxID=59479 RepID=A0A7J7VE39_RHIFE|nr:hypothetical protein mRhiFer1_008400 [Rhinolophus ferrumequinum]